MEMSHMSTEKFPLVKFDMPTYFGDVSLIYKIDNRYHHKIEKGSIVYSIANDDLKMIFSNFGDFYDVLKIRAIRRYRYFKRLTR